MDSVPRREMFGVRSQPHTIVIARGDKVRHWTVRPWLLAGTAAMALTVLLAGAGASTLFVMGGPVLEAVQTRDAQTAAAYGQRIAVLPRQLDRITTRQVVDRDAVAKQVEDLLAQQAKLTERFERLTPLVEKARDAGLRPAPNEATDDHRTDHRAELPTGDTGNATTFLKATDELLPSIRKSVDFFEEQQEAQVADLLRDADDRADQLSDLLGSVGIAAPEDDTAVGGPFVGAGPVDGFSQSLSDLQQSLDLLERLRTRTARLPLGDPMPGSRMTSSFGARLDPFFREAAVHTGVDFAGASGTPVRPTAPGRVVSAGPAGGYGLMVEVSHGDGLSTRYGHLSRIDVAAGDKVGTGDVIGAVGSTGRSTGPHLHYEVRVRDEPVDPNRWIKAGRRLAAL